MKQLLIVAVALASVNVFASRARMIALGNSAHLIDTQTVLSNPADIMMMGDYANFESGLQNTETQVADCDPVTAGLQPCNNNLQYGNNEGSISRSMGMSKLGLAIGFQSKNASVWGLRNLSLTGISGIKSQQNPVNLTWGMKMDEMNLGATLVYSNYNDKAADIKESSSGVRLGMRMGMWDAKLGVGLGNTFSNSNNKFKGTTGISGGAGYMMDGTYFNGAFETAGFKTEDGAGTEKIKYNASNFTFGALNTHKMEASELFYGIALSNTVSKSEVIATGVETKTTTSALPITLGMEVDAATWMTLRGSIKQSTLINSKKVEASGSTSSETGPDLNNTVASVGAGLKFNKLTVDGTLQGLTGGAATQELNGNKLLGTVGVTYMF